jgi:hypothetical protein
VGVRSLGSTLGVAGTVLRAVLGAALPAVTARSYERDRYLVTKSRLGRQEGTAEKTIRKVRPQLLAGVGIAAFVLGMIVAAGVEWSRRTRNDTTNRTRDSYPGRPWTHR